MKTTKILLASLLLFVFCCAAGAQDTRETIYKYDKGQSDVHFALMSDNAGQQVGMHFNIGAEAQVLEKVQVFVSAGVIEGVKANIHIIKLDDNNSEIIIPFVPTAIGKWNDVDLLKEKISTSGNVMVAIEWLTPTGEKEPFTSFFIGVDLNANNHNGYIKGRVNAN